MVSFRNSYFILIFSLLSVLGYAQHTLKVSGRFLTTPCGDTILLRGVNKMNIWNDKTGASSMKEISQSNANAVRIVWAGTGKGKSGGEKGTPEQLDQVMTNCINEGMIPIPECHDATGTSWNVLPEIISYWTNPKIVEVLKKHQTYSILNIANEAGVEVLDSVWLNTYLDAITKIRKTGLKMPLMIDGDHWGQSTDKLFRFGTTLLAHDPEHNLLFSFHPWWPSSRFGSVQNVIEKIQTEVNTSIRLNLPFVIGEFSYFAPGCDIEIPHKEIMEICHWNKIGWMAWSWGPGNSDCREMDMTRNGTFETFKHESWAGDVLNGYYGLKRTAVKSNYILHKGECAPYCSKPKLTNNLLLCENEVIILKNPLNTSHFKSIWYKDNVIVSTDPELKITESGRYSLQVDSSGCKKSTEVEVYSAYPNQDFPSKLDLCTEDEIILGIDDQLENVTYVWFKDGKTFQKSHKINVNEKGNYQLIASRNNCNHTYPLIEVSSPFLQVKNVKVSYEGNVMLKVKGGSGEYAWFYLPNGGAEITRGSSYSPYINSTTTYYIEDLKEPRCKRTPLVVTFKK